MHQLLVDHHVLLGQSPSDGCVLGVLTHLREQVLILDAVMQSDVTTDLRAQAADHQPVQPSVDPLKRRPDLIDGGLAVSNLIDTGAQRGQLRSEVIVDVPEMLTGQTLSGGQLDPSGDARSTRLIEDFGHRPTQAFLSLRMIIGADSTHSSTVNGWSAYHG